MPLSLMAESGDASSPEWHYTVRPADSLQNVAAKLLTRDHSWSDLVRYNHIDDLSQVKPGAILRIPVNWLKFQPKPATTLSTSGAVLIKRARSSRFAPLKAAAKIHVGDEISTRQGTALIRFADGSILRLEPDSALVFNKLAHYGQTGMVDTRMRLKKGAISTEVSPLVKGSRFEVTTPSAVAAVRGTRFRLKTDDEGSTLEVTEGEVAFTHEHGSTMVKAGEGARISEQNARIERVPLKAPPEPQFANTVTELPATLAWESQEARQYRYELLDAGGQQPIETATLEQPQVQLDRLENGDYVVSMRAIDDAGFEGLDTKTAITIAQDADIATLIAPADNSTLAENQLLFSWQLENADTLSRVEIAKDAEFKDPVSNNDFNIARKWVLNRTLDPGTYYWRVASSLNASTPSYSATRSFMLRGKLKLAKILSVNYLDNQVGLFWNPVKEAQNYRLQISSSSQFNTILKEETISKTSAHIKLTPGKRYYARVKALASELYDSEYGPVKELFIPEE